MRLAKAFFNLEFKNILTKRNIILLSIFSLILLIFFRFGLSSYRSIIDDKKNFQKIEEERVKQYVYYDQYGGFGIKLLIIPDSNVIFQGDPILKESVSTVNTAEKLNISKSIKSEDIFIENSDHMGFTGIFLIASMLLGLMSGYEITKNPDYFKFLSRYHSISNAFLLSVFTKIIIYISTFAVLFFICILFAFINDINLLNYSTFTIFFMVFLIFSFFFALGLAIGNTKQNQSTKIGILAVIYFVSILLIPLLLNKSNQFINKDIKSLHLFELDSLKEFMAFERRFSKEIGIYKNDGKIAPAKVIKIVIGAINKELKSIKKREKKRKEIIIKNAKLSQALLSLFPVTFYQSVNKELSSCGALGFIDFYSFTQEIKNDFITFIINEKYLDKAIPGQIKIFNEKDENKIFFFSKSHIPFNFWLGVLLTFFYTVGLLFFSYRIQKKRYKLPEAKTSYTIEQEKDNPLFVLCENVSIKEDIFNYYQSQKASVCLEKINTDDFMFNGVKAHELLKHLSALSGVDEKKAIENMGIMGIKDLTGLPVFHEIICKIYAAVTTASEGDLIVMNDFLKNESRELERDIFNLLLFLEKSGKKIIYLSCDMKQSPSVNSFDDKIKVDGFETFPLNLNRTSLR